MQIMPKYHPEFVTQDKAASSRREDVLIINFSMRAQPARRMLGDAFFLGDTLILGVTVPKDLLKATLQFQASVTDHEVNTTQCIPLVVVVGELTYSP